MLLDRLSHISFDVGLIKKYVWIFHLFIIALIAKSASDLLISYVDQKIETPLLQKISKESTLVPPLLAPPELKEFNIITQRNIFNPSAPEEDLIGQLKDNRLALDEAGATPTTLPFELVGTIILSDAARSVAAIKNKEKNEVESYQVGDPLFQLARVYRINPFKVYLQNLNTGQLEYVEIKEEMGEEKFTMGLPSESVSGGVRELTPGRFVIDRNALESTLANPNEILTHARAVPNIVGGKIQGFRIFSIRPGSVYEKLGIKNGDTVLRINGVDLDSPAKALEFYGAISSASEIALDIERDGQKFSYNYSIK